VGVRLDAVAVRADDARADVDDVERVRVVELLRRRRPGMEGGLLFLRRMRNRHGASGGRRSGVAPPGGRRRDRMRCACTRM
jgi:hypothetical protein